LLVARTSLPKLTVILLLVGLSVNLSACSKKIPGDTSFSEANKAFEKQLSGDQRKAAIRQLQTETGAGR
jgi:hypothetical protein